MIPNLGLVVQGGINRLMTVQNLKVQNLRNNEYYGTQETFDDLYLRSKQNNSFKKLIPLITDCNNIYLAYRNIKRNKGSETVGTNSTTIKDVEKLTPEELVELVQSNIRNYKPRPVRRVEIPKGNGGTRPLGIPTFEDRLIQQCVKQVLEPICEAKFHPHSYGFRPNRSQHHAISRAVSLVNINGLHYVVDIDIKGFFDNVNHGKLMKQLWTMGIRDKQLLCIISKMLKAEVEGIGIPDKGTPQGGILSPLLSNIVLNELDWWISDQWETFKARREFKGKNNKAEGQRNKFQSLRNSSALKEIFLVRYADDFKIFCRNYEDAQKIFIATKKWIKERLGLEISTEKSKVVNLKKNHSNFLGFDIRTKTKGGTRNGHVAITQMSKKNKDKVYKRLKDSVINIQENKKKLSVDNYNALVLGLHEYFKVATNVSKDFRNIGFNVFRVIKGRLEKYYKANAPPTKIYKRLYGDWRGKRYSIEGITLFPVANISHSNPRNFNQEICSFTKVGREHIHKEQKVVSKKEIEYLIAHPVLGKSIEYNDNRIALFIAQQGKCAVTGEVLDVHDMHCHHKKPIKNGGSDKYENLILIKSCVHKLIHMTDQKSIQKILDNSVFTKTQIAKINELRKLAENGEK